ncbi:PrsW family intramembrane metalloprotease [Defluviitalea phaphyphila]|uniref:PrsW family intramembrane metalloprotease n=1 Tax=Defluviitalea phaphyphila TaxID=1473580 RepID=UPI0013660DD6|nr:PrsW family intramembrane metalloprotease [Defluviitalea phaphyphila]
MSTLLQVALAPVVIIIVYIYIRDKYEKEPIKLLFLGLLFGLIISFPIMGVEMILSMFTPSEHFNKSVYTAFVIAAGTEELFKFIVLYFLIWRNKNFNEKFDGIVYAVFISLGFSAIENILYVFNPYLGGYETAFARAIFAVPGHGLFGVAMGYYFALAKFEIYKKVNKIFKAFFIPWILHGVYDFILIIQIPALTIFFLPFVLYLWIQGMRKMKKHIQSSPFKPRNR